MGNSSYAKFAAFGKYLDSSFKDLGAKRIHELGLADELFNQEESFRKWSIGVYKSAMQSFSIKQDESIFDFISEDEFGWNPDTVQLCLVQENVQNMDLCESLSKFHNRQVNPVKMVSKRNLQAQSTGYISF